MTRMITTREALDFARSNGLSWHEYQSAITEVERVESELTRLEVMGRRTEIIDDPKDEGYHSLHADLWDAREGK